MIHVFKRTPFYERAQQKSKINRISLFNSYSELLSLVHFIIGDIVDPGLYRENMKKYSCLKPEGLDY